MRPFSEMKELVALRLAEDFFENALVLDLRNNEVCIAFVSEKSIFPVQKGCSENQFFDLREFTKQLVKEDADRALFEMAPSALETALENEGSFSSVYRVVTREGEIEFKNIRASYFEKKEKIALLTCIDVSEIKRAEEENKKLLKEAIASTENANNIKSDFLSRMSHDIRTPLNGIIGITEIAIDNTDRPDKISHYLERIQFASNYLLEIVNDILDMSRIESGKTKLVNNVFMMGTLVNEIITVLEPEADRKRIKLETKIDNNLYYGFIGDTLRIKQVLINLLSNGLKYTYPDGTVTLTVSSGDSPEHTVDKEKSLIVFSVIDNGIGISSDFQAHMFDPFEQAHGDTGSYSSGAGLGLSIVKKLVQMMDGTIDVYSAPGEGSTFTVTIPLVRYFSEDDKYKIEPELAVKNCFITTKTSSTGNIAKFSGQRILIAEDNEMNMEIIKTMIVSLNLKCDVAWNGLECVELFKKSRPGYYSIVLMDIRMPVMDGREATRRIRLMQRPDVKNLPIIALSADAFDEEVKASQAVGMNDYIIKPVNRQMLSTALKKFLE